MGLEMLDDHIKTVETSIEFPLRVHENDKFALEFNTAISTLMEHGLNEQMIELLVTRNIVSQSDCDSMWLGPTAGQEAQEATQTRLDEINRDLSRFADETKLNDAVREALHILPTMEEA